MLDVCQVFQSDPLSWLPGVPPSECGSNKFEWRVVGKLNWSEQLLIFWHATVDLEQGEVTESRPKTPEHGIKISLFDLRTQASEVIFVSDEDYDISQCCIDQEKTRIAFVCKTSQTYQIQSTDLDQNGEVLGVKEDKFACYWAALNVELDLNHACPLNSETPSETRVHFLSSTQLIAFVLQDGIFLYTLPSKGDIRKTALSVPVLYEKLSGPFPWAQWDVTAGRVFYLQFRSPQRSQLTWSCEDTAEDNSCSQPCPFLVGLQFHASSSYETLLNMPLETLIIQDVGNPAERHTNDRQRYSPLINRISDLTLGLQLQVFIQSSGAASICQGIIQERHNGKRSGIGDEHDQFLEISYSVTFLHHSCTLHCTVEVQGYDNTDFTLLFASWEDGILVMVPNLFTHLLDSGLEHEPSNHVLFPDCFLPLRAPDESLDCWLHESSSSSDLQLLLISSTAIKYYDMSIASHSLVSALKHLGTNICVSSGIHLAILHQLLVHYPDFSNVEMAIGHLLEVMPKPQITKLFQEFLLGGSFACSRDHLEDKYASLLPPSLSKPLEVLHETSLKMKLHSSLSYTTLLKDVKSMLLSPNERHIPRRKMTDPWSQLWNHLRSHRSWTSGTTPSSRFSAKPLRELLLTLRNPQKEMKKSSSSSLSFEGTSHQPSSHQRDPLHSPMSPYSICQKILSLAAELGRVFGGTQLMNPNMDPEFPFPSCSTDMDDTSNSLLEQMVSLSLREISVHFVKCLPGEGLAQIDNAACTYVANQLHQSQLLCHIIFQALHVNLCLQGSHDSSSQPYAFLHNIPITTCKRLFSIMESYFIAVEQLSFPRPQGFDSFFSVLAYHCLDFHMFLRYVDYGVVQLTSEVLHCVSDSCVKKNSPLHSSLSESSSPVKDINSDEIAMEIIARLPRHRALRMLKQWDCPSTRIARMHDIVEQYLHYQYLCEEEEDDESDTCLGSVEATKNKMSMDKDATSNEDASSFVSALPVAVVMSLKHFLLHLKQETIEDAEKESPENISASIPYLTRNLELVRKTQLNNIAQCYRRL